MTEWRIAPRIRSVSLSPVIWYTGFRPTCGYPLMMRIKNVDEGAALMLASALMQALCFRVAVNLKYPELPCPDAPLPQWQCQLWKQTPHRHRLKLVWACSCRQEISLSNSTYSPRLSLLVWW